MDWTVHIPDILPRAFEFIILFGTALWTAWQQWLHKDHARMIGKHEAAVDHLLKHYQGNGKFDTPQGTDSTQMGIPQQQK